MSVVTKTPATGFKSRRLIKKNFCKIGAYHFSAAGTIFPIRKQPDICCRHTRREPAGSRGLHGKRAGSGGRWLSAASRRTWYIGYINILDCPAAPFQSDQIKIQSTI
jgi:hypothetical protein